LILLICDGTGAVSFVLEVSVTFQPEQEDSAEPPDWTSKCYVLDQKTHQNDSTNLTMSIVCIHVPYSVAFSNPEPLSLLEENERHEGDGIRLRRR
jgi:hypothetical protein